MQIGCYGLYADVRVSAKVATAGPLQHEQTVQLRQRVADQASGLSFYPLAAAPLAALMVFAADGPSRDIAVLAADSSLPPVQASMRDTCKISHTSCEDTYASSSLLSGRPPELTGFP